jgi:serine protease inhibitor
MRRTLLALAACATFLGLSLGANMPADSSSTNRDALVKGNGAFAYDLYAHLRRNEGNIFFSPYSISTALAMTYAGARGQTAEQMAKVLHFQLNPHLLHPACAELTRALNGYGLPHDYQLSVANSLWGARDLRFLEEYQQLLKSNYGSRIRPVDFRHQPDPVRQFINRWVEERTNGKIKDLLQRNDITKDTALVLVNAIYFKAAWEMPFEPSATNKDDRFETGSGKTAPVAMMRQAGDFNYVEDETLQALELPYEGRELSFIALLPKEKNGLARLEKSLTAAKFDSWLAKLKSQKVRVELPKFKMTSRFDLADVLSAMGMPLAFRAEADFSGMTTKEKLSISKVLHQAFVEVNEEGTEAAAATAVAMMRASAVQKQVMFRADHPFLFLLRDNRTGSILFVGRLANPS